MTEQHPTSIVDPGARIGDGVSIGPYAVIEGDVTIHDGCRIGPHVHIARYTTIGANTEIHAGAVIGDTPQDLHFCGDEASYTTIGSNCRIREYVTIHRGTSPGTTTAVGDNVMLMAFAHLGHNCQVSSNVVVANGTLLAGHVEVQERAFISAAVLVHQFVRIGRIAMIGGGNHVAQDIPPFCMLQGSQVQGPNVVGLQRSGMGATERKAVRWAIKKYFFSGLNRPNAISEILAEYEDIPEVREFVAFLETTKRGITAGRGVKERKY